jgi:hypothetical protein
MLGGSNVPNKISTNIGTETHLSSMPGLTIGSV